MIKIADLNDQARTTLQGVRLVITRGIFELPDAYAIVENVRAFAAR